MRRYILPCLVAGLCLGLALPSRALNIVVDYSADAATENFFSARPVAKAAVDAAAANLSALLAPTHLSIISPVGTPNVNAITGTSGSTTVTADWDYRLHQSLDRRLSHRHESVRFSSDTVTIFVGMNAIGEVRLVKVLPAAPA